MEEMKKMEQRMEILLFHLPNDLLNSIFEDYLSHRDLANLRLVSRQSLKDVSRFWKQWVPYEKLSLYLSLVSKKEFDWLDENQIYGLYFKELPMEISWVSILLLTKLKELDVTHLGFAFFSKQMFSHLPPTLEWLTIPLTCCQSSKIFAILDQYPNLKVKFEHNLSLLHELCQKEPYINVIEKVLSLKYEMKKLNDGPITSLYVAIQHCGIQIVKLLLESGANPNLGLLPEKFTPLMEATLFRKSQLIPLLIKYGADVELKDRKGKTALDYATKLQMKEKFLELCKKNY